jgi:hypothetical protein
MRKTDRITGWTVGLLALQFVCQGLLSLSAFVGSSYIYEDTIQTFDGLVATPLSGFLTLLFFGFGMFRTLRLSLILTLVMLIPLINAAIALGLNANYWDVEIQGNIQAADQAVLYLNIAKYVCFGLIAVMIALAFGRASAKARLRALAV